MCKPLKVSRCGSCCCCNPEISIHRNEVYCLQHISIFIFSRRNYWNHSLPTLTLISFSSYICKIITSGFGEMKCISAYKHFLLFQGTQLWFLTPTWKLIKSSGMLFVGDPTPSSGLPNHQEQTRHTDTQKNANEY